MAPINCHPESGRNRGIDAHVKIILMDLDLTLFDYTTIRRKTARQTISLLNVGMEDKKALSLYEWIVRHSRSFQAIGLPDFKHFWNSPELYSCLVLLSKMDRTSFLEFRSAIEGIESEVRETEEGKNRLCMIKAEKTTPEIRRFLKEIRKIETNKYAGGMIKQAVRRFNLLTEKLPLFNEADDLLVALRDAGIERYIVTEGVKRIQLEKFRKLGLQRWVNPKKVLVVDEKNSASFLNVLRAIQNKPDDPRKYLDKYSNMRNSIDVKKSHRKNIKLAVVGDRYDKDIAPLKELFGEEVITIRLLCGKYANEYDEEDLRKRGLPLPSLATGDLNAVKELLLNEEIWEGIRPIDPSGGKTDDPT